MSIRCCRQTQKIVAGVEAVIARRSEGRRRIDAEGDVLGEDRTRVMLRGFLRPARMIGSSPRVTSRVVMSDAL